VCEAIILLAMMGPRINMVYPVGHDFFLRILIFVSCMLKNNRGSYGGDADIGQVNDSWECWILFTKTLCGGSH
jgi:hypothetical protein